MMKRLVFLSVFFSCAQGSSAQELSSNIIIDQFGYLPNSQKIAVIKNPVLGFDKEMFISDKIYQAIIEVCTS